MHDVTGSRVYPYRCGQFHRSVTCYDSLVVTFAFLTCLPESAQCALHEHATHRDRDLSTIASYFLRYRDATNLPPALRAVLRVKFFRGELTLLRTKNCCCRTNTIPGCTFVRKFDLSKERPVRGINNVMPC